MTKLQEVFSENLKQARKRANITQEELAEKVGVSPKHISVIERGVKFPTIKILEAIANALGIPAYKLFIESSTVEGISPTEIIDNYNQFLEGKLSGDLRKAGVDFLSQTDKEKK